MVAVDDPVGDVDTAYHVGLKVLELLRYERSSAQMRADVGDSRILADREGEDKLRPFLLCDSVKNDCGITAVETVSRDLSVVYDNFTAALITGIDINVISLFAVNAVDFFGGYRLNVFEEFSVGDLDIFDSKR